MKSALIGGIGNVLLGDDGVGPYLLKVLESSYIFGANVGLVDLGTPALDLTHQIAGMHTVILIDAVNSDELAGTIIVYRKSDILREVPALRLDPHSPALAECLMTAEMLGASPENVLLVGIVGENYVPGRPLSAAVSGAVPAAVAAVVKELHRLGFECEKRESPSEPAIWWAPSPQY